MSRPPRSPATTACRPVHISPLQQVPTHSLCKIRINCARNWTCASMTQLWKYLTRSSLGASVPPITSASTVATTMVMVMVVRIGTGAITHYWGQQILTATAIITIGEAIPRRYSSWVPPVCPSVSLTTTTTMVLVMVGMDDCSESIYW